MIFGPIARFRRLESRFSGQKGPRSSEMRFYIEITGYIKNHQHFKILFWSRESKKPIFTIFLDFFYEKMGRKSGNLFYPPPCFTRQRGAPGPGTRDPGPREPGPGPGTRDPQGG